MPRSRERGIKDRIRGRVGGRKKREEKTECKFFWYTRIFTKFPVFWWFCWTNLIVGVQTAARGAVCVFCRSHFEDIWERESRRWFFRRHSREDRAESVTKRFTTFELPAGSVSYLLLFNNLHMFRGYSWEATTLTHLYEQLRDASYFNTNQLAKYATLAQVWNHTNN